MRFDLSHGILVVVVAVAAFWLGRNVALPGDDVG